LFIQILIPRFHDSVLAVVCGKAPGQQQDAHNGDRDIVVGIEYDKDQ
jgi:hypothetical protein